MITVYLLDKCEYCKDILKYIKSYPTHNICLIIISRDDLKDITFNEPRIKQFPIAFTGAPKINGLPYKNSHYISGSKTILETLINNFNKGVVNIKPNVIRKQPVIKKPIVTTKLGRITKHGKNCFGSESCITNRPISPTHNKYMLQAFSSPSNYGNKTNFSFGNKPTNYGNKTNSFMSKPSNYGNKTNFSFGNKPTNYGNKTNFSFGNKPTNYGNKTNSFMSKPSNYGNKTNSFMSKPSKPSNNKITRFTSPLGIEFSIT